MKEQGPVELDDFQHIGKHIHQNSLAANKRLSKEYGTNDQVFKGMQAA